MPTCEKYVPPKREVPRLEEQFEMWGEMFLPVFIFGVSLGAGLLVALSAWMIGAAAFIWAVSAF